MTINCQGNLIDLTSPKVMGILNLTPNSFYDGGKFIKETSILNHVDLICKEGATFVDLGAYSSKPNAEFVNEDEELRRLIPIVILLKKKFPELLISIDTFRSRVAKEAIESGACMINDISAGGLDEKMMSLVAELQVPYVMMHMKGTPQTMQGLAQYVDITKELLFYFSEKVALARSYGINDIIIDPGFGFAKTNKQNYEVLSNLDLFKILEFPILAGMSRKSMIYKSLDCTPEFALNGTTVLNTIALQKGANILRVHDVKEAIECVNLLALL